ncbi:MAG: purine-binding chemotaxis protein CheW [Alphaproteobacteria bacterium]|jgi:purine-binding chemotaxis protein CheW
MTEEIQSDIGETQEFVTLMVGDQLCGIDVLKVRDVLRPQQITRVPLASGEVSGLLNLRGRIVTAINLRARLGLDAADAGSEGMSVVIERRGELYSLAVDSVGEVLKLSADAFERNPATLDAVWRQYSQGVYRLKKGLLVVLDDDGLLNYGGQAAA